MRRRTANGGQIDVMRSSAETPKNIRPPSDFLPSTLRSSPSSQMIPRVLPGLIPRRLFSVSARMASMTPLEDAMRDKVRPVNWHGD